MRESNWKDILAGSFIAPIIIILFNSCLSAQSLTVGRAGNNATVVGGVGVTNVSLLTKEGGNVLRFRSSNGTDRNSRQLWSVIQNAVDKYKNENSNSNGGGGSNNNKILGTVGTLATSFIGNLIANGISSNLGSGSGSSSSSGGTPTHLNNPNQFYQHPYHDQISEPTRPPPTNPNDYMHYLLLNSQANQHTSLPHYQKQYEQSTSDLIEKYKEQMSASSSTLGNHHHHDGDSDSSGSSSIASTGNQILSKLALGSIFDDGGGGGLEKVANFLSFGSFEKMMGKVNKFDKLKCIPRLLCQMVAKRDEDSRIADSTSTTTTRRPGNGKRRKSDDGDDGDNNDNVNDEVAPAEEEKKEKVKDEKEDRPKSQIKIKESNEYDGKAAKEDAEESNENDEDDDEEDDDDDDDAEDDDENDSRDKEYIVIKGGSQSPNKKEGQSRRSGRLFKLNGADTALEQFVKFLELMQLKDWSLYPYLNGAYQGHQVDRTEDCAYKFPSCPFSDDQLVYYFNNYNGGFFQSI